MAEVTPKKTWWDRIGMGLMRVAKVAAVGARWASEHPEVLAMGATIAGHPEVAAIINQVGPAAKAAGEAIQSKRS